MFWLCADILNQTELDSGPMALYDNERWTKPSNSSEKPGLYCVVSTGEALLVGEGTL